MLKIWSDNNRLKEMFVTRQGNDFSTAPSLDHPHFKYHYQVPLSDVTLTAADPGIQKQLLDIQIKNFAVPNDNLSE